MSDEKESDFCIWVDDFHGYVTECDPEFYYPAVPEICEFCGKETKVEE